MTSIFSRLPVSGPFNPASSRTLISGLDRSTINPVNLIEDLSNLFFEERFHNPALTVEEFVERYPDISEDLKGFICTQLIIKNLCFSHLRKSKHCRVKHRFSPKFLGYELLGVLGIGGMGIVYKAFDFSRDQYVALKVPPPEMSEHDVIRFRNETLVTSRLEHSNIIKVYDSSEQGAAPFFTMELVDGVGLDDVVRFRRQPTQFDSVAKTSTEHQINGSSECETDCQAARTRIDILDSPRSIGEESSGQVATTESGERVRHPCFSQFELEQGQDKYFSKVAKIGWQVASALAFAHAQGTIHRDIKPSNILVDRFGKVSLIDFGLACARGHSLDCSDEIVGTVRYMAPERFEKICTPQSDVYSLGITLYELLALRPAYHAAGKLALIKKVRSQTPKSMTSFTPNIPDKLVVIVEKAIARDPDSRYANAIEMAKDLERFLV